MMGTYDVMCSGVKAGTVKVEKQGLYYSFSCRCNIPGKAVHRLTVICGDNRTDLGICVPVGTEFVVNRKLPCKQFPGAEPEFLLVSRRETGGRRFVPVYPEEPFAYMTKLKNAFMEIQDGQAGIVIRE